MKFVRLPSGLLIPSHRQVARKNPFSGHPQQFSVYLTWHELTGSVIPMEDIEKRLGGFDAADLIINAARINYMLDAYNGSLDRQVQANLAAELLNPNLHNRFIELQRENELNTRDLVFPAVRPLVTPTLMLYFIKKVIIAHPDLLAEPSTASTGPVQFGDVLFALSDHCQPLSLTDANGEPLNGLGKLSNIVRNLSFNDQESLGDQLARYYALFFELPRKRAFQRNKYMSQSFAALFRKAAGLPLSTVFAFGALVLNGLAAARKEFPDTTWLSKCEFDLPELLAGFPKINRHGKKLKNLVAMDLAEARKEFSNRNKEKSSFDFDLFPMVEKPILQIQQNQFVVPFLRFLAEKFTEGIFWTIHNNLPPKEIGAFRHYWGMLIQEYVAMLLRSHIASTVNQSPYELEEDIPYKVKKQDLRSTDILCYLPHPDLKELWMIDVTFSFFPLAFMVEHDNSGAVSEGFRKIVEKTSGIHRAIRHLKQGYLTIPNVEPEKVKTFRPMIVTMKLFPTGPTTWNGFGAEWDGLLNKTKPKGDDADARIAPVKLLSVVELEQICFLHRQGVVNAFDTMRNWANDPIMSLYPIMEYWRRKNIFLTAVDDELNSRLERMRRFIEKAAGVSLPGPDAAKPML